MRRSLRDGLERPCVEPAAATLNRTTAGADCVDARSRTSHQLPLQPRYFLLQLSDPLNVSGRSTLGRLLSTVVEHVGGLIFGGHRVTQVYGVNGRIVNRVNEVYK